MAPMASPLPPHPADRLVFYCRTTSASTAPCTSRRMCCPTHCACYCAPSVPRYLINRPLKNPLVNFGPKKSLPAPETLNPYLKSPNPESCALHPEQCTLTPPGGETRRGPHEQPGSNGEPSLSALTPERTADAQNRLTNSPGHLWRDKWTALSGPRSPPLIPGRSQHDHRVIPSEGFRMLSRTTLLTPNPAPETRNSEPRTRINQLNAQMWAS